MNEEELSRIERGDPPSIGEGLALLGLGLGVLALLVALVVFNVGMIW
jgi:hypothetical protein